MKISVRNNNVDRALSIFRKKCNEIILEVRERQHYEKPTSKRNRKRKMAIIRERKRQREDRKQA